MCVRVFAFVRACSACARRCRPRVSNDIMQLDVQLKHYAQRCRKVGHISPRQLDCNGASQECYGVLSRDGLLSVIFVTISSDNFDEIEIE